MSIQAQLQDLYDLGQIDRNIDSILQKASHVPEKRESLQKGLAGKEVSLKEKKEKRERLDKDRRGVQGDLELGRSRLVEFEQKVNRLKTQREYQAAVKEMTELKKGSTEMEGRVAALTTELESLDKSISEEEPACLAERERVAQELKGLEEEEKTVFEETRNFREKREALRKRIEPELLNQYEKISVLHSDAVVQVRGGACEGCYMRVPPQLYIEIQKFVRVHLCPSCHRILNYSGGQS